MKTQSRAVYYGKKLLLFVCSVFVLSAAVFFISRLAPGDPLRAWYGDRAEKLTPEQRAWAEEQLGLNAPLAAQYLRWLTRALHGDFGISYQYKMEVTEVIRSRAGNTLVLGGTAFLLTFFGALGLGALCAWHEDRPLDRLLCRAGAAVSCVPAFWLSLMYILIFSVTLRWLPSSGAYTTGTGGGVLDRLRHLVLPLAVIVPGHLWYYAYIVRSRLLAEVRASYVLLARAKGLTRRAVLFRHCLRSAFPSHLSLMAVSAPHLLGGTYIVETVFSYPGLGTLSYESARYRDYNLLMLLCLLSGTLVILCSMLAQILSERIDPRLRAAQASGTAEVNGP